MKVLTLIEPWATFIKDGYKKIETRSWKTYYRGELYIHTSLSKIQKKVLENKNNVGIFICGSGIGMSMAANRNPKIRAALCMTPEMAMLARKDNDANVLCLPARFMKKRKAIAIIKVFLTTSFEGGRHARRIKKISGDIK